MATEKKFDGISYRTEEHSIEIGSAENYNDDLGQVKKHASASRFSRFMRWIEVDGTQGYSTSQLFLLNYDLKPVEAERRTWKWWNFVCFWLADSFNVNTWQIAATGVVNGLSWWSVWITVWLGYGITAGFVVLSARVGIYYHISFPCSSRSSWGIWGAMWPIFQRVVMSCIWSGSQAVLGGQCVELMLRSIFGNNLESRIPNKLSSGTGITSFGMLSFFLFWLFQLPAIYLRPHQVRHLFTVKAIICPIAGFAFLIWTLVKADGGGPVIKQGSTISGSAYGWEFVNSTMNALANFATLIVNAPDFSRLSKKKSSAIWSQLITIPVSFSITCLIGILVSSASTVLYGETYWNPLDVLGRFLDHQSPGARGGVFLIAFAFSIAQLGTNISANFLSAGTDMTAMLPRYVNIRRGGYIAAVISYAICPWNILSSSSMFSTYLSAYSVFLSAIAGVAFCDYFIVKKGFIILEDLYKGDSSGSYYYSRGFNWRAYAAYIGGILPNIVGFVGATKTHKVPEGANKLYYFSFFTGYAASAAVLLLLTILFPIRGMPEDCKLFEKRWFEEWQDVEHFDELFSSQKKSSVNEDDVDEKSSH